MDLCGFEPFVRCKNKNNNLSTRTVKSLVALVLLLYRLLYLGLILLNSYYVHCVLGEDAGLCEGRTSIN